MLHIGKRIDMMRRDMNIIMLEFSVWVGVIQTNPVISNNIGTYSSKFLELIG